MLTPWSVSFACAAQAGSPPDVWLQLLERCAATDPGCQPAALRSLAQQLAEQRALTAGQIAGLQAQLSCEQQRAEALQQQHVAAQQLIAGMYVQLTDQQQHNLVLRQQHAASQQQLSAQQQTIAEQGARITALEGQLQQLLQRLQ